MIPQSFQEILTNSEHTGFYQVIALIVCMLFFIMLVVMVLIKPKRYYKEVEELPVKVE